MTEGESRRAIDLGVAGCTDAVEIGRGGFGVVYRAHQPEFHRTVAVKVLGTGGLDDAARLRFQREIAAMGAVSGHPNIVTVYQAGFTPAGHAFIVMAFEPHGTLGDRVSQHGPGPWESAVSIGIKLSGALDTAHRQGVLHRDVKPENVLVSAYGEPKLADFGIARIEGSAHTSSGLVTATVAHAAPEILMGSAPTAASDIYALGSTIVALILGRPAFALPSDESFVPMLRRITLEPPPDLRSQGVPDAVCAVLERAMEKEPAARPASAADLGRQLQSAQRACGTSLTELILGPEPQAPGGIGSMGGPARSVGTGGNSGTPWGDRARPSEPGADFGAGVVPAPAAASELPPTMALQQSGQAEAPPPEPTPLTPTIAYAWTPGRPPISTLGHAQSAAPEAIRPGPTDTGWGAAGVQPSAAGHMQHAGAQDGADRFHGGSGRAIRRTPVSIVAAVTLVIGAGLCLGCGVQDFRLFHHFRPTFGTTTGFFLGVVWYDDQIAAAVLALMAMAATVRSAVPRTVAAAAAWGSAAAAGLAIGATHALGRPGSFATATYIGGAGMAIAALLLVIVAGASSGTPAQHPAAGPSMSERSRW